MKYNKLHEVEEHLKKVGQILKEDYRIGYDDVGDEIFSQKEEAVQEDDVVKDDERVSKIREIALGGLQDYAHDVDGEKYQFFKKIWLMCDKAVSEKDSIAEQ